MNRVQKRSLPLLWILSMSLGACGFQPQLRPAAPAEEEIFLITFHTLVERHLGGPTNPSQLLLRSAQEARAALGENTINYDEIDFDSQSLIAVSAGERPTGGYEVQIDRLLYTGSGILVEVTEHVPAETCQLPPIITTPQHIVVATTIAEEARFNVTQSVIENCESLSP